MDPEELEILEGMKRHVIPYVDDFLDEGGWGDLFE